LEITCNVPPISKDIEIREPVPTANINNTPKRPVRQAGLKAKDMIKAIAIDATQ
jgi:hypothetical protein